MNSKIIRNILLLLIIPIIITIVFIAVNKSSGAAFSSSVNYGNDSNQVTYNNKKNDVLYSDETDIVYSVNRNYTYIMFTAIILVIIFCFLYFYLTRKKQW